MGIAGPLTLERPVWPRACPCSAELSELGSDKSVSTTVYVRNGRLLRFDDKNPDKKEASRLLEPLLERLEVSRADYIKSVATALGVSVSRVEALGERPRLAWEDKALVLDYPLLQISGGERVLEMRLCFAICTAKASTKIWARVNMPVGHATQSVRVRTDEVPGLCKELRAISNSVIEWGHAELATMVSERLDEREISMKADVKATILGIRDHQLEEGFERLDEAEFTAAKLLVNDSKLDERLTEYCQKISSIDESHRLSDYTRRPVAGRVAWFKMPTSAVLAGGGIVRRTVLFLMRDSNGHVEIIGLAYDDSEKGDIAVRAGAALSKVIGPWI